MSEQRLVQRCSAFVALTARMSARRQLRVCCEGLPRTNAGRRALRCSRLRLYAIGDGHHSSETGLPGIPACTRRAASVHRETRETDVRVQLNIDGTGVCRVRTGIPFLDHMLHQVSAHGLVDLEVHAVGDYEIDDHHTNEDVGIAFGMALAQAVGEKRGIQRFGHFVAPLDEALVQVVMDFSGRGYLNYELQIPTERVGSYDTQLVREFFAAIASNAQLTLHIRQLAGLNSHHIIEATFKAFARALRMACEIDPRRQHQIPSSKGALTDQQALRSVDGA